MFWYPGFTYNNRQQADCRLEGPCGWINIRGAESIFKGHIKKNYGLPLHG